MTDHNARQAGLTDETLYQAVLDCLMNHGMQHTEDTGSGEKYPLVDKLCAPGDDTIKTGKEEVEILAEDIVDAIGPMLLAAHSADARNGEGVALTDEEIESEWRMSTAKAWVRDGQALTAEPRHLRKFARGIFTRAILAAPAQKCTRCEYIGKCDCEPAPAPAAQADDDTDYKACFTDACLDLAAIHTALGIPDDEAGGAEPILEAITELQARQQSTTPPECTCPSGNGSLRHPCPVHAGAPAKWDAQMCAGWRNMRDDEKQKMVAELMAENTMLRATPADAASEADKRGEAGNLYLCKAWGETDLPAAAMVTDLDGVRAFLIAEWLGSADDTHDDGTNSLDDALQDMQEQWAREGDAWEWSTHFEIGGVSVQKVYEPAFQRERQQGADRG